MVGVSGLEPPYAGVVMQVVTSLKEAMPSNDTIFTNTCYHAKK